ncbi:MAG: hypothetical protein FJ222_03940 [Lentisphaerae bacterium]|nr:hypothetical protein [Lentisphaerota bacterium]
MIHDTQTAIYDQLIDPRGHFIGPRHWLGNLRWVAEEVDAAGCFVFRTAPIAPSECDQWKVALLDAGAFSDIELADDKKKSGAPEANKEPPAAIRTFFGLKLEGLGQPQTCAYRPDGVEMAGAAGAFSLFLPYARYGAVMEGTLTAGARIAILSRAETGRYAAPGIRLSVEQSSGRIVWNDGAYTLVFRYAGSALPREGGGFDLAATADGTLRLAVAFHADRALALAEADALFADPARARSESRASWEDYLASCPVARFPGGYTWKKPDGTVVAYAADEIVRRQYWQWCVTLVNVYDLPFNDLTAYLAPDKTIWFGVWSNDGGEALFALAHTNRHALARKCLVEYVRTAVGADGALCWYLHATGVRCLGNPGDSGFFSHGVPAFVTALAEYVEQTGDRSILHAPAGEGGTVWEKVRRYMRSVYDHRDLDHDGVVEWRNLWEGGADDKVGCFFSQANLKAWIHAVTTQEPEAVADFYRKNQRPQTNFYEASFFLSALRALERLARLVRDEATARYASERFAQTCELVEKRHWHEADGFYYDWDTTAQALIRVKNQDAFYLPYFLDNPVRAGRLFEHLDNPEEFALLYTPTLAKNEAGFRPHGYWSGGHWPREMVYIARSLAACGRRKAAVRLLVKAICCAPGKAIPENMNPVTGEDTTRVTGMAYNAVNVLELVKLAP